MKIRFKKQSFLEKKIYHILKEELLLNENVSEKIKRARDIINSDIETLTNEESIRLLKSLYEDPSEVVKDHILNAMFALFDNSSFSDQFRMAKSHKFFNDALKEKGKGIDLNRVEGKKFGRLSGDYTNTKFIKCDFSEADIAGANFEGSYFEDCNFVGVKNHDKAYLWDISIKGGTYPKDWRDRGRNYEYPDEEFEKDPMLQDMEDSRTWQAQLDQHRRRR